jgi:hypothetical protein
MSEYGYIPEAPEQSFGNNKGIFTPKDIYDLTRADKYTNYGQLELIETQIHSSDVAQVDFTSIKEDIYNVHFVTFNNFQPADNLPSFLLRFYESGVLETGSVYQTAFQYGAPNSPFGEAKSTGGTSITLGGAQTTSTGGAINGYFYIYNAGDSSKYTFVTGHSMDLDNYNGGMTYFGSAVLPQASTVDGIRFLYSSGNIANFDISLYGIRYS